MQSPALLPVHSVPDDQIAHVDHVSQLADFREEYGFLIEIFGLAVEDFQTVESALQTQVGAHNAHIAAHDGLQFFSRLRDQHHFLVQHRAVAVPIGNIVAELDARQCLHSLDAGAVRKDQCFQQ